MLWDKQNITYHMAFHYVINTKRRRGSYLKQVFSAQIHDFCHNLWTLNKFLTNTPVVPLTTESLVTMWLLYDCCMTCEKYSYGQRIRVWLVVVIPGGVRYDLKKKKRHWATSPKQAGVRSTECRSYPHACRNYPHMPCIKTNTNDAYDMLHHMSETQIFVHFSLVVSELVINFRDTIHRITPKLPRTTQLL